MITGFEDYINLVSPRGTEYCQSEAKGNIFVSNEVSITNVARKHSQHCLFY